MYVKLLTLLILIIACLTGCAPAEGVKTSEAMVLIEERKYEEALEVLKEAEENGESVIFLERGRGMANMGLSEYTRATENFIRALTMSKGYVGDLEYDISYYLAAAQFRSGEAESAKDTYTSILNLKSDDYLAYFLRGKTELFLGDVDSARKDFSSAVRCSPEDPDLYIDIYECMSNAGYAREAENYLQSAMEVKKISRMQKGKLYYWLGDYEQAKTFLEESDSQEENEVILYLGMTYEALGDMSYAASLYKKYLEINPGDVNICNRVGLCEMQAGRYRQAAGYFEQALGVLEQDDEMMQSLRFNQITAYEFMGDYDQAGILMRSYIKDYPDDEVAKRESVFLTTR